MTSLREVGRVRPERESKPPLPAPVGNTVKNGGRNSEREARESGKPALKPFRRAKAIFGLMDYS